MLQSKFSNALCRIFKDSLPEKVGIALSGGIDSMCLASLLHNHIITNNCNTIIYPITINHNLRPTSSLEINIIRRSLRKIGIDVGRHLSASISVKSNTESFEEAARLERYKALIQLSASQGVRDIMLAHHLDDQLETFIMRLFGNSGIFGLSAMNEISKSSVSATPELLKIIRPMLEVDKNEIYRYCLDNDITWVQDFTNFEEITHRNTIRKYLIDHPNLKRDVKREFMKVREFTSDIESKVSQLNSNLKMNKKIVCDDVKCEVEFTRSQFEQISDLVLTRFLFKMFYPLSPSRNYHYSFNKVLESVPKLQKDGTFSLLQLQWDVVHQSDYVRITVQRQNLRDPVTQKVTVAPNSTTDWFLFDSRFWFRFTNSTQMVQNYRLRTLMKGDRKLFGKVPTSFKYSSHRNLPVLLNSDGTRIISLPTRQPSNGLLECKLKENIYSFS